MARSLKLCTMMALSIVLAIPLSVPTASAAGVTSMSIKMVLPSGQFGVGVGYSPGPGGYRAYYEAPQPICGRNPSLPSPLKITSSTPFTQVRLEFYKVIPSGCSATTVSGIALRVPAAAAKDVGTLRFPTAGEAATGRFVLQVASSTPLTDRRVHFSMFQQYGQPLTNKGQPIDAFTAGETGNVSTATNPLWNGRYVVFLLDKTTGRKVSGLVTLNGETTLNVNLDAPCFGIDECQFSGTVPTPTGAYHPVSPTRIVDTRLGLGISSAVRQGDGRSSDPNPNNRLAARRNHEIVVVNRGGVPLVGVSAVLANVTVYAGSARGSLRALPKPSRTSLFYDQSSFPASNTQAPIVHFGAGDIRSSTQLLKVGVGGRIRLQNTSTVPVHITVDVLGWFDSSQPGQSGQRVVALNPTRLVDTRSGLGTQVAAMVAGETRPVLVRDGTTVPGSAGSVFAVLTTLGSTSRSTDLVWPNGAARPVAASHAESPSSSRANLVSAPTDGAGAWSLFHKSGSTHVMLDVIGYSTGDAGAGGMVRTVASTRVLGVATQGSTSTRRITAAAGARAAFLLVTTSSSTTTGYARLSASGSGTPSGVQVRWAKGLPTATLVLVPVGADGTVLLEVSATVTTAVDVLGWVN